MDLFFIWERTKKILGEDCSALMQRKDGLELKFCVKVHNKVKDTKVFQKDKRYNNKVSLNISKYTSMCDLYFWTAVSTSLPPGLPSPYACMYSLHFTYCINSNRFEGRNYGALQASALVYSTSLLPTPFQ